MVTMKNKTVLITNGPLINDTRRIPIVQKIVNTNGLCKKKFLKIMTGTKSL